MSLLPPLRRGRAVATLALGLLAVAARADEVTVAVAANFAAPMAVLAKRFGAATGHVVRLTSGSTGRLYSQIVAGAPFDVLLAADTRTPARLLDEGHAVAGSRVTYAIGQLVLWSARPGFVDDQGAVLAGDGFERLALANPKLAPYGAAAMAVLEARALDARLAPRLVTGESIAQAYHFVATGNAELGFVALSQVMTPGRKPSGSAWRVPQALYPEIRQDAVLLVHGKANAAAAQLMQFLRGDRARELIAAYGYALADRAAPV